MNERSTIFSILHPHRCIAPSIWLIMSTPEVIIKDKTFTISIPSLTIQNRTAALANTINADYKGKTPLLLGVLNGSVLFAADLFKQLKMDCELSFVRVASYQGLSSSGKVANVIGLKENIEGRHVLVIEDIIDSGGTVTHLIEELQQHKPASLKIAALLFKPAALKYPIKPDYFGFEVANDFLVGYGLDYEGLGRNLNDIYVLKS